MIAVCRRSTRNAFSGVLKALSLYTTNRQGTLITYIRGKGIIDPLAVKGYVTYGSLLIRSAITYGWTPCPIATVTVKFKMASKMAVVVMRLH